MHIAFLLTQSLSSPSGLGRYWPISKELVRLGYEVTVVALHHDLTRVGKRRFIQAGVHVWYVSQMHVRKIADRKLYFSPARMVAVSAAATWHLMWAALRTPADVYHVAKPHPMNSIAGYVASRVKRKPLLVDCDDYEATSSRFGRPWQRTIVAAFEDRMPRLAQAITVNSRFMAARLQALGISGDRIVYVPNAVDRERFAAADGRKAEHLRQELGLRGRRVILYVGSLSLASHAVDLLLEAFAKVRAVVPEAVLLVVGGGEDGDRLQRQSRNLGVQDDVLFVGRVPPALVPHYFQMADVSADPVRNDDSARARSPLKVFESLAVSTPVVTGDVGDRREAIGEANGVLVRPGDADALAAGILHVLQSSLLSVPGQCAGQQVRLFWDELARDFERVYRLGERVG